MSLRNKRTGRKLSSDLRRFKKDFVRLVTQELPGEIEEELLAVTYDSFKSESYSGDRAGGKWRPRKRDKNGNAARSSRRGLLIGSGELRRATEGFTRFPFVGIRNDKIYAKVHNEGLKAGRGKGFQMPQRQFMPIPGQKVERVDARVDKFLKLKIKKYSGT